MQWVNRVNEVQWGAAPNSEAAIAPKTATSDWIEIVALLSQEVLQYASL